MYTDTFEILIHTQPDTVWEILLEWLESPQRICPGMGPAKIVDRSAEGMTRELSLDGKMVREKVLLEKSEGRIVRELLEHPIYSGRFITRMVPTSVQNPMAPVVLQQKLNWNVNRSRWKVCCRRMPSLLQKLKVVCSSLKRLRRSGNIPKKARGNTSVRG